MRTMIGGQVRALRLERRLTQAQLAELIGRSERWLIDVEGGGVDPRLSDAVALARVLGVGVDRLLAEPTPVARRAGRPPPRPPAHTARTVHGFRGVRLQMAAGCQVLTVAGREGLPCAGIVGVRGRNVRARCS